MRVSRYAAASSYPSLFQASFYNTTSGKLICTEDVTIPGNGFRLTYSGYDSTFFSSEGRWFFTQGYSRSARDIREVDTTTHPSELRDSGFSTDERRFAGCRKLGAKYPESCTDFLPFLLGFHIALSLIRTNLPSSEVTLRTTTTPQF